MSSSATPSASSPQSLVEFTWDFFDRVIGARRQGSAIA
jgi:hypothetical protein